MANEVEILLKASDKASQSIKGVEGELKKLGGAGKTAEPGLKNAGKALGDLVGFAAKGAGVIAGAGLIIKKAFDLGEEGAKVTQTAESFKLLLEKVGAAPDLLKQLQEASKGTIDDMSLMSSTATLLAGTQGELGTALANSTPKLLEIAKAAQKLNPALGDTTFLYDSLARGIKRASPLILDNLGIIVKIGEANEKYAKSIGKTVEQLTAEDQKMALLNATLEAGDIMLDQVGGSTDSATDAFARLDTSTKNLADSLKMKLAPFLADAAEAANLLLTGNERLTTALQEHAEEIVLTTESYEDYKEEIERINKVTPSFIKDVETLTKEQYEARKIEIELGDTRSENITTNTEYRSTIEDITEAAEDEKEAQQKLKNELSDLKGIIAGPVSNEYDNFMKKQDELKDKAEGLRAKIEELEGMKYLTEEQKGELEESRSQLGDTNEALEENAKKHEEVTARIIFGYLEQEAASDGLTQTEIEGLIAVGTQLGLYDEKTASTMASVQQAWSDFNESGDIDELKQDVKDLHDNIDNLPREVNIGINISQTGKLPPLISPTGAERKPRPNTRRQYGGTVFPNMPYLVGERGPELFVPSSSGNIVPNNQMDNVAPVTIYGGISFNIPQGMDGHRLFDEFMVELSRRSRNAINSGVAYAGS